MFYITKNQPWVLVIGLNLSKIRGKLAYADELAAFKVSPFSWVHVFLTLIVQQHILWLQVSINDPLLVEVLHALDNLRRIVTGPWLIKAWVVLIHIVDVIPGSKVIDQRQGGRYCVIWTSWKMIWNKNNKKVQKCW